MKIKNEQGRVDVENKWSRAGGRDRHAMKKLSGAVGVVALNKAFFLSKSFREREVTVFFSSRRRHTRWTGDWSSDVYSSDLPEFACERTYAPWVDLESRMRDR